jgi:ATP-binding cassette subfamily C (CFTR/MRP) protein 4
MPILLILFYLSSEWELEIKKKREKASLLKTIFRLYGWQLLFNSLLIVVEELTKILQPLLISMVLVYFNGGIERNEALIYGAVISVCAIIGGILHHPYYFNSWRIGMKIRVAASGLMYRKIFRLSVKALDSNFSGDIINLLSTDATRIEIGVLYLPFLFIGPIQIVIVITVILQKIGVWFLAGLLLLLLILPIQALVAKAYNNYRAKVCAKTDERISMLTETLNNIKIIKMYCWEKPFTDRLTKARK